VINVLGLGNVLMGDDGFGPTVVTAFDAEYLAGPDVAIVDVGTPGLDLTPWLADADAVIIVDTIKSDLAPGTLRLFDKGEILRHAPAARVGPHDPGLKEALLALDFAGRGPRDVDLVGIVPGHVGMTLEMTPQLRAKVPAAVSLVAKLLRRCGAPLTRRRPPLRDVAWWTAGFPQATPQSTCI
jgi:hydrogenase maturation protease